MLLFISEQTPHSIKTLTIIDQSSTSSSFNSGMCLALKISPASHVQKGLWELPRKWIKVYLCIYVTVTIYWLKLTDIPFVNMFF